MSIRLFVFSFVLAVTACTESTTTPSTPAPDAGETQNQQCSKCGEITNPDVFDPANLCEASQPLFDNVIACVCGVPDQQPGKCLAECGATVCNPAGGQPDDACGNCIAAQCGPETGACLNDV
jgi:hypothetical protein